MSRRIILISGLLRQSFRIGSCECDKSCAACRVPFTSLKHQSLCTLASLFEPQNLQKLNIRCLSDSAGDKDDPNFPNEEVPLSVSEYNPKEDPFFTQDEAYGSKVNKGLGNPDRPFFEPPQALPTVEEEEDLFPPTTCCRSGCPNCVWIDYVEKLSKKYSDPLMSREKVLKELDSMEDQSIKAFIMMELKFKGLI